MISNDIRKKLSDHKLLAARNTHMDRLSCLFKGGRCDKPFVLWGVHGTAECDIALQPEQWVYEALGSLAVKADKLKDEKVFRPLGINPWPYGVHLIDKLFGADVFELDGEAGNWQVNPLPPEFGKLHLPDIDSHPAWQICERLSKAFIEAEVSVPYFSLPVLSSPVNILLNLFGQAALVGMLTEPEAVSKDLRAITDLIKSLHSWFIRNIPSEQLQMVGIGGRVQPPGHGQICGCSTQVLSPDLYRDIIAPLDEEVFSLYQGGGMIHLCGTHSHLIPCWRKMESMTAVQLNDRAAEDLALYFCGLREDQIIYVNPCPGMPLVKIIEITGGHRTVIVQDRPLSNREQSRTQN